MKYETARDKLFNHANFATGLSHAPDDESLLWTLWNAQQLKTEPDNLAALTEDIVRCLEIVNKSWNGAIPSETLDVEKKLERYLVAALHQIIYSCLDYRLEWQEAKLFNAELLHQLSLTAWTISAAWNAVLAGDIDSIMANLDGEKMARKFFERSS